MSQSQCLNLPGEMSSIGTWMHWHKALKGCVGRSKANDLFLQLWDRNNLSTTIELRRYMEENGVDMDKSALNRITDTGAGIVNWVGTGFEIGGYAAVGILVILVGGVGMIVFNMAKSPEGSARLVAGVATRGKSEMIPGGIGGGKSIGGSSPKGISGPKTINVKANNNG